MLQIFLVGNIHFIEFPLGSHTAVLNMSPKNACLYVRSQGHGARMCCCVGIRCRFLCRGKVKFQKLFEEVSVSPCLLSTNGLCFPARAGSSLLSLGSLCDPAERAEEGGPSPVSTRVPCLTYSWCNNLLLSGLP